MNSDQISTVCSDAQYADHRDPLKIVHRIQIRNVISNWVCCDLFYRRGVPRFSPFAASLIAFRGAFCFLNNHSRTRQLEIQYLLKKMLSALVFFQACCVSSYSHHPRIYRTREWMTPCCFINCNVSWRNE